MAKLRPELRKKLPPFDPIVADDAHIILDAIEAERWIDVETPVIPGAFDSLTEEQQARVRRAGEIATARQRVMGSALIEYARLYPTEKARLHLNNNAGSGCRIDRHRVRRQILVGGVTPGIEVTYEHEYTCKFCGVSIASLSSLADANATPAFWIKLQRHTIRCACLLVVETHEQLVYAAKVASGDIHGKGRWKTEPPPPRIQCPPPPKV